MVAKAQKDDPLFNPSYLGAIVYYDGVALNSQPQPLRSPVPLVNSSNVSVPITQSLNGKMYIPLADPYGSDGLGVSGILHVPDGSGVPYNLNVTTDGDAKIGLREGGDSDNETASGLVRRVIPRPLGSPLSLKFGDCFIFTSNGSTTVKVVDKERRDIAATHQARKAYRQKTGLRGAINVRRKAKGKDAI